MRGFAGPALVAAIVAFAGCTPGTGSPDAEEGRLQDVRSAIESQNARFERYVASQQFDSLAAIYTSDGQVMAPNAEIASGENLVGAFEGMAEMGVTGVDLQTIEVEAARDFAYEVGRYAIQGPGDTAVDNGKYIVIWQLEDGEWKIHRDIFNSNQPPPGQGASADTTRS